ncbi:hypothetical protein AMATHDRAFT_57565 [Amanita thiersii Skay4041]|uniref:Uncharacterized protein n=1 Tax=Amanita thiersii Skay4041 TaxID=703135 RepID=A0A2A9NNT2_9AGAR|nr:hypothetical protein AMATHDRAFT_57565 [Amanita thiersii Skay4041]
MPPTDEEKDDLLLSCRYGDIDDVREFTLKYGQDSLASIRDDNGNCVLHMVSGNGHIDVLDYLLPLVPSSLLSTQNNAGSTPLHWAALNSHLEVVQKIVQFPDGPGSELIDIKNAAGRSPLTEAEMAGWEEGAKWLVQHMSISDSVENEETVDMVEDETAGQSGHAIEVEIQDADGQIAKMKIGEDTKT